MAERLDPQQGAVYRAEAVLQPLTRRFTSVEDVRVFVAAVFDDDDLWDAFEPVDDPTVELEHRLRRWDAITDGHRIRLSPRSGMDAATVLHEVAHVLTVGDEHGPAFCAAFWWLVRRWMGFHAAVALRSSFAEHGVVLGPEPGSEPLRWATRRPAAGRARS